MMANPHLAHYARLVAEQRDEIERLRLILPEENQMPDDVSLPAARPSNRDLQTMPLAEALEVYMPSLAEALPDHIPLQRFKRVLLTAVNLNPELRHADRRSLFNACVKAAHDGLYPDGREAALVVFETSLKTVNERGMDVWLKVPICTYMPMIAGIRKRMRNSGEVVAAIAEVVYRNDKFRVIKGIDGKIDHEPPALDQDRGDPVGAYAQIKLRTGEIIQEVMTKKEIEHIRDTFSRGAQNAKSPWRTSESEMWRKTVLRRCSKSAPADADLDQLLSRDDEPLDEPHPASFPPPRPTREQFVPRDTSNDDGLWIDPKSPSAEVSPSEGSSSGRAPRDSNGTGPRTDKLPAESAEPLERKEDLLHRPSPQATGDSPQDTGHRRRRRTKAEMEAARAAEARSSMGEPPAQSRDDTGSIPAAAATYDVVDREGEVREFSATTDAAEFLARLFAEARAPKAILALVQDNAEFMIYLSKHDPQSHKMVIEAQREAANWKIEELATARNPATTESPNGTGDAPEAGRQGPAGGAPIIPAGPPPVVSMSRRISYAIEPVHTKTGQLDLRTWYIALFIPRLRQSKNMDEFEWKRADNAEMLAQYRSTLTPAALIAAMKEIDDIEREIPL